MSAIILLLTGAAFCAGLILGWSSKIAIHGITSTLIVQSSIAIVGIILSIQTYKATKSKELKLKHFTEKAKIFEDYIETLKDMTKITKDGNGDKILENTKIVEKFNDLKYKSTIWANDKTIDAMLNMETVSSNDTDQIFEKFAKFYENMREELGHNDRKDFGWDLIAFHVIDHDRHKIYDAKNRMRKR